MFVRLVIVVLLLVCSVVLPGKARPQKDLSRRIQALFDACNRLDTPGGFAAAVIKDGRVLFQGAYGFSNSEHKVPFTIHTVSDLASVSKQFTGFAIATLIQEKRLRLDDDIRRYLPELPDFGDTITVRHLLYHTSGIRDWVGLVKVSGRYDEDVIIDDFLMKLVMNQQDLNFRPGERFRYSNTGYFLLANIVSRVTGQPFSEWMRDYVFVPLGMTNTHFCDDHRTIIPNRASSYRKDSNGVMQNTTSNLEAYGSSSLFSTLADMIKWVSNFETRSLGGPEVWDMMRQRGVLNDGQTVNYGFGISINEYGGLLSVGHGGSWGGYLSQVTYYPELHLVYVFMTNRDPSGVYVDDDLLRLFVPDKANQEFEKPGASIQRTQKEINTNLLDEYAGIYEFFDNVVRVETRRDHLLVRLPWEAVEFYPESDNKFFRKDFDAQFAFLRNEVGVVDRLVYYFRGSTNPPFKKLDWNISEHADLADILGEYYSPELHTRYRLMVSNDRLVMWHMHNEEILLLRLDRDHYLGSRWWCEEIEIVRDENDQITGFTLTADGGNIQRLRFVKL